MIAHRIPNLPTPRPPSPAARLGLTYERKFWRAISRDFPMAEHNPAFRYFAPDGSSHCCVPDILLPFDSEIIVFEIKLSWTPLAIQKLRELYCPAVESALGLRTHPIVVVKNLRPESPRPQSTIARAVLARDPLLHWIGKGPIL
jgi:hypothetical protein